LGDLTIEERDHGLARAQDELVSGDRDRWSAGQEAEQPIVLRHPIRVAAHLGHPAAIDPEHGTVEPVRAAEAVAAGLGADRAALGEGEADLRASHQRPRSSRDRDAGREERAALHVRPRSAAEETAPGQGECDE
jgi:hypothetical protein